MEKKDLDSSLLAAQPRKRAKGNMLHLFFFWLVVGGFVGINFTTFLYLKNFSVENGNFGAGDLKWHWAYQAAKLKPVIFFIFSLFSTKNLFPSVNKISC